VICTVLAGEGAGGEPHFFVGFDLSNPRGQPFEFLTLSPKPQALLVE
jgi:hypothetical protein